MITPEQEIQEIKDAIELEEQYKLIVDKIDNYVEKFVP